MALNACVDSFYHSEKNVGIKGLMLVLLALREMLLLRNLVQLYLGIFICVCLPVPVFICVCLPVPVFICVCLPVPVYNITCLPS